MCSFIAFNFTFGTGNYSNNLLQVSWKAEDAGDRKIIRFYS